MSEQQKSEVKSDVKRTVDVVITSKRYGSSYGNKSSTSLQTISVPVTDEDSVRLVLAIDLRNTESIVIQPVRRDLGDTDGLIGDATRLANA